MSIAFFRPRRIAALAVAGSLIAGFALAQDEARCPIAVASARVTVSGTSNVLDWSATTNAARTANVKVTNDLPGGDFFWVGVVQPGAVESFDVIVPVADLKSDRDNFTADMHAALAADKYPEIVFRLSRLEARPGGTTAFGMLRVAGVEKEVVLPLITTLRKGNLLVLGSVDLLMTDFGIAPPTAMMGTIKTDPKVTIRFEAMLAKPTT